MTPTQQTPDSAATEAGAKGNLTVRNSTTGNAPVLCPWLQLALDYASRGWCVFPLSPRTKDRPLLKRWPELATTDHSTITNWWTQWPEANIALATGKKSGVVVLDVDPRHGGDESIRDLEGTHGPLPRTPEVLTGSEGRHLYFHVPAHITITNSAGKVGPGLDIRGEGGYVVAPPSIHPCGRPYLWEVENHWSDLAPAAMPVWMVDALAPPKVKATDATNQEGMPIPKGRRNDTLYRLARGLKLRGLSSAAILSALHAENITKCDPPLFDDEILAIVTHALEQPDRAGYSRASDQTDQVSGRTQQLNLEAALVHYGDLLTLSLPERRCLLTRLREGGLAMVFGPRGLGKTMLGMGLTASLVTGCDFLCWTINEPVGVLYVDGEMALDELRERMTCLLPEPPKAPLCFLSGEITYSRLERDLVLSQEETRQSITSLLDSNKAIRVVVIDNISCLFPGIDEDKKRDWEPIAAWLISLRRRGLAVVLIHHSGKGGQQRGTSGREDALDTVIQLSRPNDYDPREGCHFELSFVKARSVKGDAVQALDVRLRDNNGRQVLTFTPLEKSLEDRVQELLNDGITKLSEIADTLSISKGYASKLKRRAERNQDSR